MITHKKKNKPFDFLLLITIAATLILVVGVGVFIWNSIPLRLMLEGFTVCDETQTENVDFMVGVKSSDSSFNCFSESETGLVVTGEEFSISITVHDEPLDITGYVTVPVGDGAQETCLWQTDITKAGSPIGYRLFVQGVDCYNTPYVDIHTSAAYTEVTFGETKFRLFH